MSTSTASRATNRASSAGSGGVSFGGVLRSEWIKFRSLTSTRILLIVTFVATIGIGVLTAWIRFLTIDGLQSAAAEQNRTLTPEMLEQSFPPGAGFDLYNLPNAGLQITILVLGALAVLFISSEYSTGMIRSTMAAVPKRLPAFFAKAIILVVAAYLVTLVAGVIIFTMSIPILQGTGLELDWSTDGVIYSIFTGGLYVAGVALIGLSLGTLLRNSAGGITVLVGIFFVLPIAASFLGLVPGDFWKELPKFIPSEAGGRFLSIGQVDGMLDPWQAGLLFLGYVVVFMVPAVLVLKRRDV